MGSSSSRRSPARYPVRAFTQSPMLRARMTMTAASDLDEDAPAFDSCREPGECPRRRACDDGAVGRECAAVAWTLNNVLSGVVADAATEMGACGRQGLDVAARRLDQK